ncbi:methyltransferase domain protein, partial [Cystoisospora suis]
MALTDASSRERDGVLPAIAGEELPLPARYSYWQSVYEQELAVAQQHSEEDAANGSDGEPLPMSGDNDECSDEGEGEEWFEAQSDAIADWVITSLRCSPFCSPQGEHRIFESSTAAAHTAVCGSDGLTEPPNSSISGLHSIPILDVGCGNGRFLLRLLRRGCQCVVGVDYSTAAIRMASRNISKAARIHGYRNNANVCLAVVDLREAEPSAVDSGVSCADAGCCRLCHKACAGVGTSVSERKREEPGRNEAVPGDAQAMADSGILN